MSFWCGLFLNAQVISKADSNKLDRKDTLVVISGKQDSLKIFKPSISDYQFQKEFSGKKIFDTAFSIQKSYGYTQYNNKDNFGKVPFANIGSGFQSLVFELDPEKNLALLPTNKSFNILGSKDVRYYDVKTPTTTFVYHNSVSTGANLYSTYTQNIGKNFNFAVEYVGLRSLGHYRHSLAVSNNTLFSGHYLSKNGHYEFFTHFLHQNINNEENGGISTRDNFLSGDSRFRNRNNLQVNLLYSNSRFAYRRYYFAQQYAPFNSEKFPFKIRHTFSWQSNKYYFGESNLESAYYATADDLVDYPYNTKKYAANFSNNISLLFDKEKFKFSAGLRHQRISLGVGQGVSLSSFAVPSENKENRMGATGTLEIKLLDKMQVNSNIELSRGNQFGNFIRSENLLNFEPVKGYVVNAKVNFQSAYPSFNYILNASPYKKFNYYFENPKNETITEIGGVVKVPFFETQVSANYFRIDNYAYFNSDGWPTQTSGSLNISQLGGETTLGYRKFHLNTKLLFQTAITGKDMFPMPNFIGRINLYYQTKAFDKIAEIQGGIKMYYFSKFASRDYFPVLNEFVSPNSSAYSIGGQPIADAYFNMKVKRMTFYVEAQHFNTAFMQNKSFTAPYFPISDFRLNLGIIWYLFS